MSDFSKLKARKNGKEYILNVCTQDTEQNIIGTKNFTKLTVNSKNVVTSINGVNADENGNVEITTSEVDLSGVVKSVNGIQPDESGNISLDVLTTPGNIIKWETDFFDISPSKTLSFDLTGTVFENEERSNINFQLVAKVKKGNNILQAGDILFTDYNNFNGSTANSEIGSYSYIRDKKLYIHFGNNESFVYTTSDGKTATDVSKSNVQCKIILTKVVSGSNGEIGATPKSVTNIVGVTDNRNLGEIFYSALPLESSQVHLLDGSVLTDATELYDYLESIKDTNPDLFTTDEEFNSEVESTGKCSKFVINTDTKSVRIPKGDSNNYIVIKSFEKKFEFNQPFSLLEPKWSDVPLNNPSWLLSNGQVNSQENYPSVYELLLNEYNNGTLKSETIGDTTIEYKQLDNGHKVVTDKTAYESILKNTGTAWYYLLDLDSGTFVLPQTNGYMKYGNSNEFIKQSLPNIKGSFSQRSAGASLFGTTGCVSVSEVEALGYSKLALNTSDYKKDVIDFNASTSSDIYADGANVNPNSVQGYLYFYVGECVGTSNSINLGDLKDKLDLDITNLKSDVTELNNLKGNISTLAFPSEKNVVLTIPASKTTLIAPTNGWFVYQSAGGGGTYDYMFMQNNITKYYGCQTRDLAGRGVYVNCPAKKGESVYFEWIDSGTLRNLKFIYATDQDIEE